MISKLIVWGENWDDAIWWLQRALDDYKIIGLKHNIPFHKRILETPDFLWQDYGTDFIPNNVGFLKQNKFFPVEVDHRDLYNFAVIELVLEKEQMKGSTSDPWLASDTFRVNHTATTDFKFEDLTSKKHSVKTFFKDGVDHI